ncbi:lymphatic vessel endothelial hyaluronic acid receptor 1 [Mixophyes fleayi]|uniref:lymphatic vessel endothelial hyaluronic acid receptor 1 n=1 Tax=Mixophyes fleayi TaxID=3061075 RepID=UPI003F4D92F0
MLFPCGIIFLFLSFFLTIYLADSSVDVTDFVHSKCRIAGVTVVENKDRSKKFNYTMAENVCPLLGMQLASKANLEKAWRYGFETCSYGWVSDKFGVISRIQNNEKCGKNQTGVLTWSIPLSGYFNAYCFNVSDTQINSCKSELMVTRQPSTVAPPTPSTEVISTRDPTTELHTVQTTPRTSVYVPSTPKESTTQSLLTTLKTSRTTTTQATTQRVTPTTELLNELERQETPNQLPQMNERPLFGGLPVTLLILALVFFIAAVVLAICYMKKYKTNLLFTEKKEEKESVETKLFKDTTTAENTEEEEKTQNGKQAATTGNSIEAEV